MAHDELWLTPPDEFVAVRDRLMRDLRADGDDEQAARVKALRRPTRDAYAVNVLVRRRPTVVRDLIDLGEQLRAAAQAADADELRQLTAARTKQVTAAVRAVRELVPGMGAATAEAVRKTLDAAVADPQSAAAVSAGELTQGLEYAGLGLAAIPDNATGGTVTTLRGRGGATARSAGASSTSSGAERLAAAEAELRAAEDEVTAAQLARAEAQTAVDVALEELAQAKQALTEAQEEVRAAQRARDTAQRAVERLSRS